MDTYIAPGRLEELGQLGSGAFGVVLHGRFRNAQGENLEVAIKQLSSTPRSSPQATASASSRGEPAQEEAFVREISSTISASQKCPHIVECYGWSAMKNGSLCLVMRKYKTSLHSYIFAQMDEPLPLLQVVKIGLDIARGLQELHQLRIVFEDLKPGNVLLDDEGNAVLADFGLSKPMGEASKHSTYTTAGTYFYMGPEKMRPDKKKVSFYSDMWSFGITLLQVLKSDLDAPYGPGVLLPNLIFTLLVDNKPPQVAPIPESPALRDLLVACLSLDGAARPRAADAVKTLEAIQHSLSPPPLSPHSAALKAKDKESEELRKKLAAVELQKEEERKQRAEVELKFREAEQRKAQQQEQSRAADARRCAPNAGAQSNRALKLLPSPRNTATLSGHQRDVNSVAFTPDGASLVSGSDDYNVKLWNVASGRCTATFEGHSNYVYSVAVSVDGRTAASGSDDGSVKLWDLDSRRCRATLLGHTDWVTCVTFSPDGATIASGSCDATIRLWDVSTGRHKATLKGEGKVASVVFGANSTQLASGNRWGEKVRLWDVHTSTSIAKMKGHSGYLKSLAFSPDGAHLLSGSNDKTIRVWDTSTKACMQTMTGHCGWVECVAVTPDGAYALSGSSDKTIRIWDWRSGACVAKLECGSPVYSVAVNPNGRMLAVGQGNPEIKLWAIAS